MKKLLFFFFLVCSIYTNIVSETIKDELTLAVFANTQIASVSNTCIVNSQERRLDVSIYVTPVNNDVLTSCLLMNCQNGNATEQEINNAYSELCNQYLTGKSILLFFTIKILASARAVNTHQEFMPRSIDKNDLVIFQNLDDVFIEDDYGNKYYLSNNYTRLFEYGLTNPINFGFMTFTSNSNNKQSLTYSLFIDGFVVDTGLDNAARNKITSLRNKNRSPQSKIPYLNHQPTVENVSISFFDAKIIQRISEGSSYSSLTNQFPVVKQISNNIDVWDVLDKLNNVLSIVSYLK